MAYAAAVCVLILATGTIPAYGQFEPEVAFDATNCMVVWVDDRNGPDNKDIYGALVDASGTVVTAGIRISVMAKDQRNPIDIAFDGTNYLIVWGDERGVKTAVYGARVDVSGCVLDPGGIPISPEASYENDPAVAFDGTNYMVIWDDTRGGNRDIYCARVSPLGVVLDPGSKPIVTTLDYEESPEIAFDGTNYLVVWENSTPSGFDVYGTRVDVNGTVLDPGGIPICTAAGNQYDIALAFDDVNYMVVWDDRRNGSNNRDIYGTRVDVNGNVLDSGGIAIATAGTEENDPTISFDGTNYLVAWEDWREGSSNRDIYGTRLSSTGGVLDPGGVAISTAADNQRVSATAFAGTDYLVIWEDWRGGPPHIYGARVSVGATVLDPDGFVISAEPIAPAQYDRHEMAYQETPFLAGHSLTSAVPDTTVLASYDFDNPCDPQGWTTRDRSGRGDFAQLYEGVVVLQEDYPCLTNHSCLWGFFDDPDSTNYACGGHPEQGAVVYGAPNGSHIANEIVSPLIQLSGVGSGSEIVLEFDVYRDLPLYDHHPANNPTYYDNLVFYVWHVRSWMGGVPGPWRDLSLVYSGGHNDWIRARHSIGSLIEQGATEMQIALGVWDMSSVWSGNYPCHSHAPLFDTVRVLRIDEPGPQWNVRHIDLFQDNFPEDGTITGSARADMAADILPALSPAIMPGDSICVTVDDPQAGLAPDPHTLLGPAVYAYVRLFPQGQSGKSGPDLEAPDSRSIGKRFPLVDSLIYDGAWWYCFRMDSVASSDGYPVEDRYCFDLNDFVFTSGDTISYVFSAKNNTGDDTYWSRRYEGQGADFVTDDRDEALASPCEFTILPAGGWRRGGDILYVDDADDRGGPPQLAFDWAFKQLNLENLVDRFDVLGPSSCVGNGLASRVMDVFAQIIGDPDPIYRKIIWNSGDLATGLIGDGGPTSGGSGPDKSDDHSLLFTFLDQHPDNPGLYMSGDGIAEEWLMLTGQGATSHRSTYIGHTLVSGDHRELAEPASPLLHGTGTVFVHEGAPDTLIAYGRCPVINDFDVLEPTGTATSEIGNPDTGLDYVIAQATMNSVPATARVVLSGFSYHYIHNHRAQYPTAGVEHLTDILTWFENAVEPTAIVPSSGLMTFLDNNYPNPFNPSTTIRYGIEERGRVSLRIYNVAGQLVRTLVNQVRTPREEAFTVTWDGRSNDGQQVASGVYFCRMVAKDFTRTRKLVLLR